MKSKLTKYSSFEELKGSSVSTEPRSKEEQEMVEKRHNGVMKFLMKLRKHMKHGNN